MSIKSMPVWKWALLLVVSFVLALFMYGLSQAVTDIVSVPWASCLVAVAVSVVMLSFYALFVLWFEKQPAGDIPFGKLAGDTAKGLGVGAGFMVSVTLVMYLCGLYRITSTVTDQWPAIITAFFHFLYVAVGEEILFRGVLFRWIDEKWGLVAALIVSSLVFGALHIWQPGATWWSSLAIAIEAGLLLGAAYKLSGTLWLPIGIHWAWNFVQGNIFGFEVSGGQAGVSLLVPQVSGPDILTGGVFGAEASVITVVLGLALSILYIVRIYRRKQ